MFDYIKSDTKNQLIKDIESQIKLINGMIRWIKKSM